jgi:hypothetical protein
MDHQVAEMSVMNSLKPGSKFAGLTLRCFYKTFFSFVTDAAAK